MPAKARFDAHPSHQPEWVAVESDHITRFRYDRNTQVLIIEFQGNYQYEYKDVPPAIMARFQQVQSKGTFFHKYIAPNYKFTKLNGETK